jgi:hypothetical protein
VASTSASKLPRSRRRPSPGRTMKASLTRHTVLVVSPGAQRRHRLGLRPAGCTRRHLGTGPAARQAAASPRPHTPQGPIPGDPGLSLGRPRWAAAHLAHEVDAQAGRHHQRTKACEEGRPHRRHAAHAGDGPDDEGRRPRHEQQHDPCGRNRIVEPPLVMAAALPWDAASTTGALVST